MSNTSDVVTRMPSSSSTSARVLMPPRTARISAMPVGYGEKASSIPRNSPNPGRTLASKDFILPKYANNRIPAKPGVRSSSLVASERHAGEEKKMPSSNLPPPSKVIEGRIARPSNMKSEMTCRSAGQRTASDSRRPQSLLVYSSASCDHLTASSSSLFDPSSRIRKRGIAAHSSLTKEASVTSSIRLASRERKIGSITSPAQRQESPIIRQNERKGDRREQGASGARKPPQSVAKVTPFPLTKKTCDATDFHPEKDYRRRDGKESYDQQPFSNNDAQEGNIKGGKDEESGVIPDSKSVADVTTCTQSPQLLPQSDRTTDEGRNSKETPSMQSLSLMIASYKVKSRKLSERLDQEKSRRLPARRQEEKFDDSYSDTECSRRTTSTDCDYCNQENCIARPTLTSASLAASGRSLNRSKNGACHKRREADCRTDVSNQTTAEGYSSLTDQSDAQHEFQIRFLQQRLNSSKDKICDMTTKLFAKTEMLASLECTLSDMNHRLQQLAIVNHEKDMEINRMRAAAEVMQAYKMEQQGDSDKRSETTNDILASPVKRLWLKSPFGRTLKGKMGLMSPKKTSSATSTEVRATICDSIESSNHSPSVNELAEKLKQTDSQLEKTRLEAISSAFHLENAKELVKGLTDEILILRQQNHQLELEERKQQQSPIQTSNAFNHFLYC